MKTVHEQAADLVSRLHREPTRRNRKACVRFFRRSAEHLRAFLNEFLSIYEVKTLGVFGFDELAPVPEVRSRRSFMKPVLARMVLVSACAAAVAFIFTPFIVTHLSASNGMAGNRVCTRIGEVRNLSLVDGSKIELTTNSCIELLASGVKRQVRLLQGEALFTVRHNDAKPFTVLTSNVAVEDVGTQFRVFLDENQTDVDVLEGKVRISALPTPHSPDSPAAALGPGEGATVTGSPNMVTIKTEKLPPGALERALAWRQGALEFRDDSLKHAVSEINRYNLRQLQIVDPAIENLSVGGRFRYSDFDGVVEAMTRVLGIRARLDESNPNIMKLSGPRSGLGEHHKRHKPAQQTAPQ